MTMFQIISIMCHIIVHSQKPHAFILVCVAYCFTFYLTQWFHHPSVLVEDDEHLLRQFYNSRDVKPASSWITFWMGGHNFQVEHHLSPTTHRYLFLEFHDLLLKENIPAQTITLREALCEFWNT